MTIEEIDATISKIRSEAGKYNFCITFEMIQIEKLEQMKEILLKAQSMSKDDLMKEFVNLTIRERAHKGLLQSITEQRNYAFLQLGKEEIDIEKMLNEYFPKADLNQESDNKLSNNSADNKGNNKVPPS